MVINLAVAPYYKQIALLSKKKSVRISYSIANDFGLTDKQFKILHRKIRRYLVNRIMLTLNIQNYTQIDERNFVSALNVLKNSEYIFYNKIYK